MSYPANLDSIEKVYWYIEQLGGAASLSVLQALIAGGSPGFPTYAGNPNSNVVASQIGELVFDTTDHILYVSTAADNSHWIAVATNSVDGNFTGNLDVSGTSTLDGAIVAGSSLSVAGDVGLNGKTAVGLAAAYTQTYSTPARTIPNATAVGVATTGSTLTTPYGYTTAAQADAVPVAINALEADVLALKKLIVAVVQDITAIGIAT